jgi:hypothetical protein
MMAVKKKTPAKKLPAWLIDKSMQDENAAEMPLKGEKSGAPPKPKGKAKPKPKK